MPQLRTYMNKLENEKARLADLVNSNGITPEMVIESLTPAERKIVDMLGGEAMIYGLVNGTVNEYGVIESGGDVHDTACGSEAGDGDGGTEN